MSAFRFKKFAGPLKWLLALALLVLVIRSGKIDLAQLKVFLRSPLFGLLCCGITLFWYSLCFLRWKILLKSQDIEVPFRVVFQLGMLGQFFQTFMPGTVGADVAKAVYIGKRYPSQKLQAVFSVIVDRGVGLFAILMLGAIAFLSLGSELQHKTGPIISIVQSVGSGLTLVSVLGVLFIAFLPQIGHFFASMRGRFPRVPRLIRKPFKLVRQIVDQYAARPGAIVSSVLISLLTHSLSVLMLFFIAQQMFGPHPWGELGPTRFVLAASLGLVVTALPISPHGLGVGQAAFASIFTALGVGNAIFGATIITAFQLITLVVNLSGFLFFVTHKQEVAEFEAVES